MKCDELEEWYAGQFSPSARVYGAYDVTEAIAELKAKLEDVNELVKESKELLKESQKMHQRCADNAIEKIRHHKFKRCLAMAWWCSAELGMLVSTWESKKRYYKRWQKRWLELADKFKEVK